MKPLSKPDQALTFLVHMMEMKRSATKSSSCHAHSLQLCFSHCFFMGLCTSPKAHQSGVTSTAPVCGARAGRRCLASTFSREGPEQKGRTWSWKPFAWASSPGQASPLDPNHLHMSGFRLHPRFL